MATIRRPVSMELVNFLQTIEDENGGYHPLTQVRHCRFIGCHGTIVFYPEVGLFACHDCGVAFHHLP